MYQKELLMDHWESTRTIDHSITQKMSRTAFTMGRSNMRYHMSEH